MRRYIPRRPVVRVRRTVIRRPIVRRCRQKIPIRIYKGKGVYQTIWV